MPNKKVIGAMLCLKNTDACTTVHVYAYMYMYIIHVYFVYLEPDHGMEPGLAQHFFLQLMNGVVSIK